MDPSLIVGGRIAVGPAEGMPSATIAARAGQGPFVIEADEYDRMFLGLRLEDRGGHQRRVGSRRLLPDPAAPSPHAFRQFVAQLPAQGLLVVCADDPGGAGAARCCAARRPRSAPMACRRRPIGRHADLRTNVRAEPTLRFGWATSRWRALSLGVPGRHNVRNALAALAVAHWHGIKPQWAAAMLHDFEGAGRRFEVIGDAGGVIVIDDYAHHPTEVAATLSAARLRYPTRRIWAVFQPHTYSRTQALLADYAHSFEDVDQVIFLDIYAAREKIDLGMHSRLLLEAFTIQPRNTSAASRTRRRTCWST